MKLYISHPDTYKIKEIVEKMVNAAGRMILIEKPEFDKDLIDKMVKIVNTTMSDTMDTLLLGSNFTIVEYDIESAVGNAFENVSKMVTWEKEDDLGDDKQPDDQI